MTKTMKTTMKKTMKKIRMVMGRAIISRWWRQVTGRLHRNVVSQKRRHCRRYRRNLLVKTSHSEWSPPHRLKVFTNRFTAWTLPSFRARMKTLTSSLSMMKARKKSCSQPKTSRRSIRATSRLKVSLKRLSVPNLFHPKCSMKGLKRQIGSMQTKLQYKQCKRLQNSSEDRINQLYIKKE